MARKWNMDDEVAPTGNIAPALVPNDTHFSYQWHLRNTGQSGGTAGVDIDILRVWDDYKGAGIRIGIVDDGFDLNHADLAANFDTTTDYDYRRNDATPMYESGDAHGTTVAGVIGADDNGIGMMGVAPDAKMSGLRVSYSYDSTLEMFEAALGAARNFDVVNNSWGFTGKFSDNMTESWMDGMEAALLSAASTGRGGLGTSIVFAAGNAAGSGDNVNYHGMQNSSYTIAVGAISNTGAIASFSTKGAAVLVSAPGVGIFTTDNTGSGGYLGDDYVGISGTSFAAPIVSGVIALMLDANETLGYRDVQEILAYSATKPAIATTDWQTNGAQNWNGTGLHFSHAHGFGLVDAHTAVRLAESWGTGQGTFATLDTVTGSSTATVAIPDGTDFAASTISITSDLTIDRIEITANISHALASQLDVVLVAPSGVESLLVDNPAGVGTMPSFVFNTVADWGESSVGTWTLKVYDRSAGTTGTLSGWSIKFLGDTANADDRYIFTDEFAGLSSAAFSLTDTDGGQNTLNAAALSGTIVLDLGARTGSIAGRTVTIAAGTQLQTIFTGDAADAVTGSAASETINTGRGDDVVFASGGQDVAIGGAGTDKFVFTSPINHTITINGVDDFTLHAKTGTDFVRLAGFETFQLGTQFYTLQQFVAYVESLPTGVTLDGTANADRLRGTAADDLISGNGGNDTVYGGDGKDIIHGNAGADAILGEGGDDTIFGDEDNDSLYGGIGSDTIYGGNGADKILGQDDADKLEGGDGTDTVYGGTGNDIIHGNADNDTLLGENGNDTLYGDEGADTLWGGLDHDILYGGADADKLYGSFGNDILHGDSGNDTLYGQDDNDTLEGGLGNDTLLGGLGNDILIGGEGTNYLYGGGGNDTFVMDVIDGSIDRLYNFEAAGPDADVLDLSNLLEGYDAGDPIAAFVKFIGAAGGTDTFVQVNADGAGTDFVTVARVYGAFMTSPLQGYVDSGALILEKPPIEPV